MNLSDIFTKATNSIKELFKEPELISPLPQKVQAQMMLEADPEYQKNMQFWDDADLREAQAAMDKYGGKPSGRVLGAKTVNGAGRNPNWEKWQKLAPKSFEALLAGARQASENTGVPSDLLMDISGAETSGGQFLNQFGGAPGQGYFQFEPETLNGLGANIDPYSATESAQLAAELIKNKQLSRWGTPGARWGTLDNPNNNNGRLTDFYTPEELNQFLSPKYQIR